MTEPLGIAELPTQKLEAPAFNQAKIRIEKSGRIKDDLKPETGSYNKQRVEEVRNIEMRSEQGDEGKKAGFQEMVVDTRDYQEKRFKMTYVNPSGQEITENLVMFARLGEDGQAQWLSADGQPLALNADLYDSRIESHKHAQGADYKATVIPRVDGRGAYTGVVTIFEREKAENEKGVEISPEQVQKPVKVELQGSEEEFYRRIGKKLKLNEQNPPKPESIIAPVVGNMFDDDDRPTLAGKVIASVYKELISRGDYKSPYDAKEMVAICQETRQQYTDYVKQRLQERWDKGDKSLTFGVDREAGKDGFHFQGDTTATRDHAYYFNKTHAHWKDANAPEVRAYITLSPQDLKDVQRHFVDLSLFLYDAGIDFSAKANSPAGVVRRTDNMVLYISANDQAKASGLIKEFLTERGLGQGHMDAAAPSPQEGLSWAFEPNEEQTKIWQEVSGSSQRTSFNAFVATRAMPTYLERMALAHLKKGDKQTADIFTQEAKRVTEVIAEHQNK